MNDIVSLIVTVLSGLAAAIPLVIKLVNTVRESYREKNWNQIVNIVMDYMVRAESLLENGADKKEWVMASVRVAAEGIDYELDATALNKISEMIDGICAASKNINVSPSPAKAE